MTLGTLHVKQSGAEGRGRRGSNYTRKSWEGRKEVHSNKSNTKTQWDKTLNSGCFSEEDLRTCGVQLPQHWNWDESCIADTVVLAQTRSETTVTLCSRSSFHIIGAICHNPSTRDRQACKYAMTDRQYMHNQVSLRLQIMEHSFKCWVWKVANSFLLPPLLRRKNNWGSLHFQRAVQPHR